MSPAPISWLYKPPPSKYGVPGWIRVTLLWSFVFSSDRSSLHHEWWVMSDEWSEHVRAHPRTLDVITLFSPEINEDNNNKCNSSWWCTVVLCIENVAAQNRFKICCIVSNRFLQNIHDFVQQIIHKTNIETLLKAKQTHVLSEREETVGTGTWTGASWYLCGQFNQPINSTARFNFLGEHSVSPHSSLAENI